MALFHRSPISSPKSFERLYEHNRLPVYKYIFGLTGGPQEEVEDLTADTFLRAWKARHKFEGDGNHATGWLIRIAKRLVIDRYRSSLTQSAALLSASVSDSQYSEAQQLYEQKQLLLTLLAELPDEQCEILTLRYLLGWRVNEIAHHLCLSENNVSVILHRSLARLREKLEELEISEASMFLTSEEKII